MFKASKSALALLILSLCCLSLLGQKAHAAETEPSSMQTSADIESAQNIHAMMLQHEDNLQYGLPASKRVFGETQLELMKIALFDQPDQVRISSVVVAGKNKTAQDLVDAAALKIFSSSTALDAFCPYAFKPDVAVNNFGVSKRAGNLVAKACREFESSNPLANKLEVRPRVFAAKASRSVVLIQLGEPGPVESWTSAKGNIHIFHNGKMSEHELLQRLIHEYYVGLDKYWVLGSRNAETVLANEGLFDTVGNVDGSSGMNRAAEVFFNGMSYPLLKGSFLLARTYEFESKVFADLLGLKSTSAKVSTADCWSAVRAIGETIVARQDLFANFTSNYLAPRNRFRDSQELKSMNEFDLMQIAEEVAGANGRFCELLSTPKTGTDSLFFTSGPRPRIGSGTQRTTEQAPGNSRWALVYPSIKAPSPQLDLEKLRPTLPTQKFEMPTVPRTFERIK